MLSFNFDIILIMIFLTFAAIGAISGLKSQIPISLNIIVPFIIIFYFGKAITKFLFNIPVFSKVMDSIFSLQIFSLISFTLQMFVAYILMYIIVFTLIRIVYKAIQGYYKRATIRKTKIIDNILGFGLAIINAYVAIYFIILPLYPMGIVDSSKPLTNLMINNPPFFSRIGHTTKSAAPVIDTVEKASGFLDILTAKNFDEYFNYLSNTQELTAEMEQSFMDNTYVYLSDDSKDLIQLYAPEGSNFQVDPTGIARTLLYDDAATGRKVYEDILQIEEQNDNPNLDDIKSFFENIQTYEGLIIWFMDDLNGDTIGTYSETESNQDIGSVISSFKDNYDTIVSNTTDATLLYKLELADTAILSYEVFSMWMSCTMDNVSEGLTPGDPGYTCSTIDLSAVKDNPELVNNYDVAAESASVLAYLLSGDNLSYVMLQYKNDYEEGIFNSFFPKDLHPEIADGLEKSYELVLSYESDYRDVVESLDPNLGFVVRLGIAVTKAKFDVYGQMEETPLFAAFVNDMGNLCTAQISATENPEIDVCKEGFLNTGAEVIVNAYLFRDENNELKVLDVADITELLNGIQKGINDTVLTKDFIYNMSRQIVFSNDINELSLLGQMYKNGYITDGAMDELIKNENGLFDNIVIQQIANIKESIIPNAN